MTFKQDRETKKLFARSWPYAPAVRQMRQRRYLRGSKLIRHYQRIIDACAKSA